MFKKIKKSTFFKNSLLYTIGSMMTPIIGMIMLPIYTSYLTPGEYGIMTTVLTLVGMLQLFLVLSLHGAVTRFFYDFIDEPKKQKEYLGSIFIFVLVFSTVAIIPLMIFSDFISSLLFRSIPSNPYYFYLIGLAYFSALLSLPMALLRAQEKAITFVIINIIKAVAIMSLTFYLIVGKGLGAESVLLSQLLITFIVILITYFMQKKFLKLSLNISFVKQSLVFSIPLLPHVLSGWVIASSDRIILEKFVTIEELGIYALAAQISLVLMLFYTSINNALIPRYTSLRKEKKIKEADRLLKIFFYLILIFGAISIPIAMFAIRLFTESDYHGAIVLLPFLLLGQMLKGFYYIPVSKLFYAKKTKAIATSSTIAAILNIAINIIFIPIIGIYAAVMSTIASEIIRLYLVNKASNVKYDKVI